MESPITANHFDDTYGNPAGGITYGHGFTIAWQNGPIIRDDDPVAVARPRNGAFVEDIIKAAIDRLEYYQSSRFACGENAEALAHLRGAKRELESRTSRRELAGVEGTHRGN